MGCSDATPLFTVLIGALDVTFCHLCCHHPLQCCDLDGILNVLVVSCLAFCIGFALDGAMTLTMKLLPQQLILYRENLQHSTNKRAGFACGRGDQA